MNKIAGVGSSAKYNEISIIRRNKYVDILNSHCNNNQLITGGAPGADTKAMEVWYDNGNYNIVVYLPYATFNKDKLKRFNHKDTIYINIVSPYDHAAFQSIEKYHPASDRLTSCIRPFHARNYRIAQECDKVIAIPEIEYTEEVTFEKLKPLFGGTLATCKIALDLNKEVIII